MLALVASAEQAPLARIADIRGLPPESAAKRLKVRLRGIVTWAREDQMAFTVQDDSAGIWVNMSMARELKEWLGDDRVIARLRPGHEVELTGVTDRGGYAPQICPSSVRLAGEASLPLARMMEPVRFFSGAEDCQRMQVRGILQGYHSTEDKRSFILLMNANPGRFMVDIPQVALPDPEALVDDVILLRGVLISRFNTRGEMLMPHLLVNSAKDVEIITPSASDPFDAPKVPLSSIAQFNPEKQPAHRLRVEGTVTYVQKSVVYLQNDTTAIRVTLRASGEQLTLGDRVEAAGFLDDTRKVFGLTEAVIRRIGSGDVPAPATITPHEILRINLESASRLEAVAKPGDFDGRLISFQARLVDSQFATSKGHRILLDTESSRIMAVLDDDDAHALDTLQSGSIVWVTGIVQLDHILVSSPDYRFVPAEVSLLLRSRDDLVVLQPPPWWTLGRVLIILAGVVLTLVATFVWIWLLRRRVAAQSVQLAAEMRVRRDAVVEFESSMRERNRLAANLHDTLLQTLGGIGFQLNACEVVARREGGGSLDQLRVARNMVNHAVAELRGSVWELRGLPLRDKSLQEALSYLVAHVGQGHPVAITLRTEGTLEQVPEFIAGNLIMIVQEALKNALRHARPRTIEVVVEADAAGKTLYASVHDDGFAFDPAVAKGAAEGHFGLAVMKDRAERLGGTLRIESEPGRGTTVYAQIPLKTYDGALV
jgi:signal transduction histidine kinase